jgi:hypothetical protein
MYFTLEATILTLFSAQVGTDAVGPVGPVSHHKAWQHANRSPCKDRTLPIEGTQSLEVQESTFVQPLLYRRQVAHAAL